MKDEFRIHAISGVLASPGWANPSKSEGNRAELDQKIILGFSRGKLCDGDQPFTFAVPYRSKLISPL
jgi:hypothetical protein